MTHSPLPRLWEQNIPQEGEDECWVGEAMVLCIATFDIPYHGVKIICFVLHDMPNSEIFILPSSQATDFLLCSTDHDSSTGVQPSLMRIKLQI